MTWGATAVAGATLISGYMGASSAEKSQDKAMKSQERMSANQLAFQREQYEDWQRIYGPIQQNLGEFYSNLTPEKVTALALDQQHQAFLQQQEDIQRSFGQKGIDSPAQQMITQQAQLDYAKTKAETRFTAPLMLASEQGKFTAMGRGIQNPYASGVASAYGQQADFYGSRANYYGNQATQGYQIMAQGAGQLAQAYARSNPPQPAPQQPGPYADGYVFPGDY